MCRSQYREPKRRAKYRGASGVMQNQTGQSREPLSGEPETSVRDSDMGRRIYARYGDSPGVITMGLGAKLARQVLRFSDRLPVLDSLHQRWSGSARASYGLLNLQWLRDFSARPKRTVTSIIPGKVTHASALGEPAVDSATAGDSHRASTSDLSSSATGVASPSSSGSTASLPARVKIHSPSARTATPILLSADDGTVNKTATRSATLLRSAGPDLDGKATPGAASQTLQISASGLAGSATDAASGSRSEIVPTNANAAIPSRVENTVTPVLRAAHEKTGSRGEVRSTISEFVHHDLSRTSSSRTDTASLNTLEGAPAKSKAAIPSRVENTVTPVLRSPDKKTGTKGKVRSTIVELLHHHLSKASTSRTDDERHGQGGTDSVLESSGHDVHSRVERASSGPPATDLPKEVKGQESGVPIEPTEQFSGSVAKADANHQSQTEGQASIGRAVESAHAGPTYVGPPIFRRSSGGALPANVFRSPERSLAPLEPPARADRSHPIPPRVLHTLDRSESKIGEHHEAEKQAFSPTASSASQLIGQAGEQFSHSGENEVEVSSAHNSTQAGDSEQHSGKESQTEATLGPPGATSSQSASNSRQTSPMIERSINRALGSVVNGSLVERTPSMRPSISRRDTAEAARDFDIDAPSRIHAQLPSSAGSSRSAAGSSGSPDAKVQNPSLPGLAAGERASICATNPILESSLSKQATSVRRLPSRPGLGGASTSASHHSGSRLVQRLRESRTVHQAGPLTNLEPDRIEMRVAPHRSVPLIPLEPLIDQAAVRVGQRDEPAGGSQNVTHLTPQVSLMGRSTTHVLRSSASGTAIDPMVPVLSKQTDNLTMPAEAGSASSVIPVLRTVESEPRIDSGNVTLEKKSASGDDTRGSGTGQGTAAKIRSAIALEPESPVTGRSQASVLRKFSLSGGLPRLGAANAVPSIHRIARFSPSEAVSGASVYGFAPATGSFRTSAFIHRATPAMDEIQRSPELGLARSVPPMNFGGAYQLVARSAGGGTGVVTPSLPTATSLTGRNPQGLRNAELTQLANRVYDLLVRRLASERQRRGQ
jgi:hypothetical protein